MHNQRSTKYQTSQVQPHIDIVSKLSIKVVSAPPFNVVDQIKRTNVNISIWDVVATIPSHKKLLQQELESIEVKNQPPREENVTSLV